jgi:hypothetical protein
LPAFSPAEKFACYLRYEGPILDAGSMQVSELAPALLAFDEAVNKTYKTFTRREDKCSISIRTFKPGSFQVDFELARLVADSSFQLIQGIPLRNILAVVIGGVIVQIVAKKFIGGNDYQARPTVNNTVIIFNNTGTIEMPAEAYSMLKEGVLEEELAKIVRPLEVGQVDKVRISPSDESVEAEITAEEKSLFLPEEIAEVRDIKVQGQLIRLHVETRKGIIRLSENKTVRCFIKNPSEPIAKYIDFLKSPLIQVNGQGEFTKKGELVSVLIDDAFDITPPLR